MRKEGYRRIMYFFPSSRIRSLFTVFMELSTSSTTPPIRNIPFAGPLLKSHYIVKSLTHCSKKPSRNLLFNDLFRLKTMLISDGICDSFNSE